MKRSLSSNQYIIREGKLVLKSQGNTPDEENKIKTNPEETIQGSRNQNPLKSSNARYIPYQHTVRKNTISMHDYYANTISEQQREIQQLKDKYSQLLYQKQHCHPMDEQTILKIENALKQHNGYQLQNGVRTVYDLQLSEKTGNPLAQSNLYHSSSRVASQLICSRQIINEKEDLTPKLISRSIIFAHFNNQEAQDQYAALEKSFDNRRKYATHNKSDSKAIRATKETEQSNEECNNETSEITINVEETQQLRVRRSVRHLKTNSIIVQNNDNNDYQEENECPLSDRESHSTESRIAFQDLLNKTIEQHQQLKELFQLYKTSSEDRVKQIEQSFQQQIEELETKYLTEKQASEKQARKMKKYKKELKSKDQTILDLIQKLRFYLKENERLKGENRLKVVLQVLEVLKQKKLADMVKASYEDGSGQSQKNVVLLAIGLLNQIRVEKQIKASELNPQETE